jgi:hypothetical protein
MIIPFVTYKTKAIVVEEWLIRLLFAYYSQGKGISVHRTENGVNFNSVLQSLVEVELGVPVEIAGPNLLYRNYDFSTIQIGDYLFDRFYIDEEIIVNEFNYANIHELLNMGARQYYIPFLIYNNDLYVESLGFVTPTLLSFENNGYHIRQSGNNGIEFSAFGSSSFLPFPYGTLQKTQIKITDKDNFSYGTKSVITSTWGGVNYESELPSYEHERIWINISQFARNQFNGAEYPFSGIQVSESQILNDEYRDIYSFDKSQKGTGIFVVPLTFYEIKGKFWEYVATLHPNNLYKHQPPEETEFEIELPEEWQNLTEDDEVEIIIDKEGNVTINVTRNENEGGGFLGILGAIVEAILTLPKMIIDLLGDMLTFLFVPRNDYFTSKFGEMKGSLFDKIPVLGQINTLTESLMNHIGESSEQMPEFKITIYGESVNIIDFTPFATIRTLIHSIILFVAYFYFIRRILRKLPKAGNVKSTMKSQTLDRRQ